MEQESFEVQVKVRLQDREPIISAMKQPEIEMIRRRHYREHDVYFFFEDPSQGTLRYREDDFIDDAKGTISNVRARLTLIGQKREGKLEEVLLSRSRFLAPATHSLRFYREYFKPNEREARFLEEGDQRVTAAKWYGAFLEPFQVDVKLKGERQDLWVGVKKIEALHVPGHSPGSLVYVTESEGLKILFGQDVHGPLDASLLSDREDYRRSLKLLLTLQADVLCEGHYGVIRGKDEVADFIESFL